MLVLFVTFRLKPGCREQFVAASLENSRGSIDGPGCFMTGVLEDPEDENRAYVFEVFSDEKALDHHHKQAYYHRWEAAVKDLQDGEFTYVKNTDFPAGDSLRYLKRAAGA